MKKLLLALALLTGMAAPLSATPEASVNLTGCYIDNELVNSSAISTASITIPLNASILDLGVLQRGDVITLRFPVDVVAGGLSHWGDSCLEALGDTTVNVAQVLTIEGEGPLTFVNGNTSSIVNGIKTIEEYNNGFMSNTSIGIKADGLTINHPEEFNQVLRIEVQPHYDELVPTSGGETFDLR